MNELLLDTDLTPEQRSYAEQVSRSGEQMMAVINDVLDLSRIEAGQFELDITDFDVRDTIEQACAAARYEAESKGLRAGARDRETAPGPAARRRPPSAPDRSQLVSNAVKFTAERSVAVRVAARAQGDGDHRVRVEVTDTGIGIDPEALDRLFEPFTQADASTTRYYGGTGLGLAIARELVELMAGRSAPKASLTAAARSGSSSTSPRRPPPPRRRFAGTRC